MLCCIISSSLLTVIRKEEEFKSFEIERKSKYVTASEKTLHCSLKHAYQKKQNLKKNEIKHSKGKYLQRLMGAERKLQINKTICHPTQLAKESSKIINLFL